MFLGETSPSSVPGDHRGQGWPSGTSGLYIHHLHTSVTSYYLSLHLQVWGPGWRLTEQLRKSLYHHPYIIINQGIVRDHFPLLNMHVNHKPILGEIYHPYPGMILLGRMLESQWRGWLGTCGVRGPMWLQTWLQGQEAKPVFKGHRVMLNLGLCIFPRGCHVPGLMQQHIWKRWAVMISRMWEFRRAYRV